MKKNISIIIFVLLSLAAGAQHIDTVYGQFHRLKRPKIVGYNYVNFDVVKLMIGYSNGTYRGTDRFTISLEGQVLYPVALFKDAFPVAWGLHFGSTKISRPHTEFIFADDLLTRLTRNDQIRRTVQRTGHVGFIVMKIVQFKRAGISLMGGASMNYNMKSNLLVRTSSGKTKYESGDSIRRISFPVIHVQGSWNSNRITSYGVFWSYDLRSRFKVPDGSDLKGLRQMVLGLSVALIL